MQAKHRGNLIMPSLSKTWLKVMSLEQRLFPQREASFGPLGPKEEKLMKMLDFAETETFVSTVLITNPPPGTEKRWQEHLLQRLFTNFKQLGHSWRDDAWIRHCECCVDGDTIPMYPVVVP